MDSAKESAIDFGHKINNGFEKIIEKDEVKKVISIVSDEKDKVVKAVSDFASKPEVSDKIEKAKDVTIDITGKAAEKIKDWLRPEKEDKKGD